MTGASLARTTTAAHGGAGARLAGKVVPMSPQLLFLLALASMATLAIARVLRVHHGRTPFPDVKGRFLLVVAFLIGPPLVVGALTADTGPLGGLESVGPYLLVLIAVVLLMAVAALVAQYVAPGRARPLLLLALAGREPDAYAAPTDPPLTKALAAAVAVVDAANAAFPRGPAFPSQPERAGFRTDWDALDAATRSLEECISGDRRLGVAVNSRASATAVDARSRLETLRVIARVGGQAWAA